MATSPDPPTRYAVFLAPPTASRLWAFASAWLGRDAAGGTPESRPMIPGFDAARLDQITRTAAIYGFHATLKPPFALAAGMGEESLDAGLRAFASNRPALPVPALVVAELAGFVALRASSPHPALNDLADACVGDFDRFRAPPSPQELAKRHAAGLSDRQQARLARWGYPYVFDEWRFHMTLSGRLDQPERRRLRAALDPLIAPLLADWRSIDAVCLFRQRSAGPFNLVARYRFGG